MTPDDINSLYNLSPDSKIIVGLVKPLLDTYKNTNDTLKILINESTENEKKDEIHYNQLKEILERHQSELKQMLIGNTLGEIGGIKKDIICINGKLDLKTPWWRTVGIFISILSLIGLLLGILIKLL